MHHATKCYPPCSALYSPDSSHAQPCTTLVALRTTWLHSANVTATDCHCAFAHLPLYAQRKCQPCITLFSVKTCENHYITILHLLAKCGSFMLLPGSLGSVLVSVKWHRSFHPNLCGFSVNFVAHMVSQNWWTAFECHQAISFKVQTFPLIGK